MKVHITVEDGIPISEINEVYIFREDTLKEYCLYLNENELGSAMEYDDVTNYHLTQKEFGYTIIWSGNIVGKLTAENIRKALPELLL